MSTLEEVFSARFENYLCPMVKNLEAYLKECIRDVPRIDRVSVRAKSIERFVGKANKQKDGIPKYSDPINQIQDQIGARIITFYCSDVPPLCKIIRDNFRSIENQTIVPDSVKEFGYVGEHFILRIPSDVSIDCENENPLEFFELQIKTLFQHAWSEAEHDIGYKSPTELNALQLRKIAFTAAQAWGADLHFDELVKEIVTAEN